LLSSSLICPDDRALRWHVYLIPPQYDKEEENSGWTDDEVKRVKFRLLGPLGQGHNIVVYIRRSSRRTAEFLNLAGRMVPMDNRTRWNSWYNMLQVLLEQKAHINKYCEDFEHELQKDLLDLADWKKLRTIHDFLQPFFRATLFTKGDKVSIDCTLFTMDILIKHLQISTVSPLPSLF
jgi:hypothetical protein